HYPTARWVLQRVREKGDAIALRASTTTMHLAAIRAGAGQGIQPCFIGDGDQLLERLTPAIPEIAAEYWVIVHRDLRRAACVQAVMEWIRQLFHEQRNALSGAG